MKLSNLETILTSTKQIEWSTPNVATKAINVVTMIFNLYVKKNIDFTSFINLSQEYFKSICPGKSDHYKEIKTKLVSNCILVTDNKYNVFIGLGKGYKFNSILFSSIHSSLSNHICGPLFETVDIKGVHIGVHINDTKALEGYLNKLTVEGDVSKEIEYLSQIKDNEIEINEDIKDKFVAIRFEKKYNYSFEKALALAKTLGVDLIKFKDKFYLENIEDFKVRKPKELKICYTKKMFDIENKCFYVNRNETNDRLDYNLTSLNKDLFKYLKFEGESLIELDIANAQFAIASFINSNIDKEFIKLSQNGSLYAYIANRLSITEKQAKGLMFRVAFDKVKSDSEFESIRGLFPEFMKWVDSYKKDNGYKLFSNLLQKTEAKIMIDGLYSFLLSKGFETFPVHDAIRVKESQLESIKELCIEYFNTIAFKCTLRDKHTNTNETKMDAPKAKKTVSKAEYKEILDITYPNTISMRWYKENESKILNELFELQTRNKQKIELTIKKYN